MHCRRVDQEGREKLLPELNKLFAGMEADSPNVVRQKAITPKLLRHIIHDTNEAILNEPKDHAADLIVGAFFFAMRACEYVKTPVPGITKRESDLVASTSFPRSESASDTTILTCFPRRNSSQWYLKLRRMETDSKC